MIYCLVLLAIVAICIIYIKYVDKSFKKYGTVSDELPDDNVGTYQKMVDFVTPIKNSLISKGFEDYLKKDFVIDETKYPINLNGLQATIDSLEAILNVILDYLKLPKDVDIFVKFVYNNDPDYVRRFGGTFNYTSGRKTIMVCIQEDYEYSNILAILCHEATHYFMYYNNLNFDDTQTNELRTDAIACLLGFSKILIDGYKPVISTTYSGYSTKISTNRLGYIRYFDCGNIAKYLETIRLEYSKDNYMKELISKRKSKIYSLIQACYSLRDSINAINPETNKDKYKIERKDELETLEEAIVLNNQLNLNSLLNSISNSYLSSNDVSVLNNILSQLENLSCDLQYIELTFKRYFKK